MEKKEENEYKLLRTRGRKYGKCCTQGRQDTERGNEGRKEEKTRKDIKAGDFPTNK